jgi:hypothetical protein
MMKLTPHEILTYLGIHVPQDGLTINPDDMYLHASLLRLLGEQMSVGAIRESDLTMLFAGVHSALSGPESATADQTNETLEKLRTTLRIVVKKSLGMVGERADFRDRASQKPLVAEAFSFGDDGECATGEVQVKKNPRPRVCLG